MAKGSEVTVSEADFRWLLGMAEHACEREQQWLDMAEVPEGDEAREHLESNESHLETLKAKVGNDG